MCRRLMSLASVAKHTKGMKSTKASSEDLYIMKNILKMKSKRNIVITGYYCSKRIKEKFSMCSDTADMQCIARRMYYNKNYNNNFNNNNNNDHNHNNNSYVWRPISLEPGRLRRPT